MLFRASSYRNLLLSGLLYLAAFPLHAGLLAGTVLTNKALAYFKDPTTGLEMSIGSEPFTSRVMQVSAFKLAGTTSKQALAGELVFFQHTLTNLGNGPDTFTLSLLARYPDGSTRSRTAGMPADASNAQAASMLLFPDADGDGMPDAGQPAVTSVTLQAGQALRLVAAFQVPADAAEGSRYTLDISADASATADPAPRQTVSDTVVVSDRAVAQVRVQKSLSRLYGPAPSGFITVTLAYGNNGVTAARDVVIKDYVGYVRPQFNGAGFAYVADSARWITRGGATLSDADDGREPGFESGRGISFNALKRDPSLVVGAAELTFVLDTVEAGSTGILQFQVQVVESAERGTGTTQNLVDLRYDNGRQTVIGTGDNIVYYDVQTATGQEELPDLTLTKQAVGDFFLNTPAQYRLDVRNVGRAASAGSVLVSDLLPKSLDWLPESTGTGGWRCAQTAETGDYRKIDCEHAATVFAGQAHPVPLFIGVVPRVAGQDIVNTALVSGGGERPEQTGNNEASHALMVNAESSIAGSVWLDADHDRRRGAGEPGLPGWRVEVLNSNGFVVRTATTGSDGSYLIAGLQPGVTYKIRFREPSPGFPIRGTPVNGEQGQPDPNSDAVIRNGIIDAITLKPGLNIVEQSLPYDPSGTVYDAISRKPVANATVELKGPAGFSAASHLVGGAEARQQVTGDSGWYQFLLTPDAPAGVYELVVKQPAPYIDGAGREVSYADFFSRLLPPQATRGSCADEYCLNPDGLAPAGALYSVNRDNLATPPPAGRDTTYYVRFNLDPLRSPHIINNHLPLDPSRIGGDQLLLQKTANRDRADIGDIVRYAVSLNNTSSDDMASLEIVDTPARGLVYVRGSARWQGQPLADPATSGDSLVFSGIPVLGASQIGKLEYRMRVGANALTSDGVNRAQATATGFRSNVATHRLLVQSGLFGDDGFITGKVFLDCDSNGVQSGREVGVPAVRLYLQDGSFVITDAEGKFSFYGLKSRTHVLKVDQITLPAGAVLVPISNRHAGAGDSRFVDIEGGDLNRADFAIGNCTEEVMAAVIERRSAREIYKAETEQRVKSRLDTTLDPLPRSDVKQLPAQGVIGEVTGDVNAFWDKRTRDKSRPASTLFYKSSFLSGSEPREASDYLQGLFAQADDTPAFVGIADGDVLPLDIFDFYVKGPLAAGLKVYLNGNRLEDRFVGKRLEDKDKGFQALEYVGTRFRYGQNELELRLEDPFGNVRERRAIRVTAPATLARMKLQVEQGDIAADGHTPARLLLKLEDENGVPVTVRTPITLEAAAGRLLVEDLNPDEPGHQTFIQGGQLEFALESPQQPGPVKVMASSGIIAVSEDVTFVPELRPMIAVGLVDGMIRFGDFNKSSILPLRQKETFEKELSLLSHEHGKTGMGARTAVFLKGRVKGEYLLTLSYDTDKSMKDRLFRDIRPDEFYPVYGDSSIRGFDAQSTSRLYVRIDKKSSYLLYGDYSTSDNTEGLELGRYSRGLTGVKGHVEEGALKATLFASRDSARQKIEEFAANGTSGPFLLNSRNILINSERVEVLTRDREQPSVILQTQTLQRFTDYEVEYFSGRLLLKAPLASLDSNLNPRSLRIAYEVESGGESFWVYGGDVSVDVTEKLRIGSMFARDEDPLQRFALNGAYLLFKPSEHDKLQLEVAQTDTAIKGDGMAYRVEFTHEQGKVAAKLKYVSSTEAFDNVLSGYAGGRQDGNLTLAYRIDQKTLVKAEVLQSRDQMSGSDRLGEMVSVTRSVTDRTDVEVGLRNVDQQGPNVDAESERYTTARLRLNHAIARLSRATTFLEYEQDVSDHDQRVVALGGEYAFASRGKAYLRHELVSSIQGPYSLNDQQQRNATVFGIETDYLKDGHVFSEYRVRDALAQREAEAAFGVRHNWVPLKNVNLSASLERVQAITGPDTAESMAATVGADLVRNENTRVSSRLEWRDSSTSRSWLKLLSVASKISDDWTFLTRTIITETSGKGDSSYQDLARFQVGMAYRQTDSNEWSVLGRYERILERERAALREPELADIDIFSVHSNYQPTRALVHAQRYAVKRSRERAEGERTTSLAYLIGQRLTYDLTRRVDLGASAAMLVVRDGGRQYSLGFEVGYLLKANFWLSGGYNFFGFEEAYLTEDENTGQGFYLRLRLKF